MKQIKLIILCLLAFSVGLTVNAQQKPGLSWKDVSKWRSIKTFSNNLSPDGQWMAYVTGPVEGDQEVVVKKVNDTTVYRYPCGATANQVAFSYDAKFFAFKVSPKDAESKAAKKINKTLYDKLVIVNLAANTKVDFDRVRSFSFSGKAPDWIAIQFAALETASKDKDAAKGTDLLLYNAATKKSFNIGSVSEFAFNKAGDMFAYAVDANGKNGNGVYVRNMKTGLTSDIDNDKASYKSINWNEEGTAFALLKSSKNDDYKTDVYSVIGVSKFIGENPSVATYSSLTDKSFPAGMGISGDRRPYWSDDLSTIFFGTNTIEKADKSKTDSTKAGKKDSLMKKSATIAAAKKDDVEKPDMIIWNWQDRRLQSAQQVQEMADKTFSYLGEYQVANNKFIQLADSNMRQVIVAPKQAYAIGTDNAKYELMSNLNGQSYSDIYLINLKTGIKTLLFEKMYRTGSPGLSLAPDGKMAVYYQDGVFYSINLETGEKYNLTGKVKASFVDELDDHNVIKPATQGFGWSADSKYILIKDNYDLWKISADGKSAV